MSDSKLPKFVQPVQLAAESCHLEGELALEQMPRLMEHCYSVPADSYQVLVTMDFSTDKYGKCCIRGTIKGEVPLVCQRCLQLLDFDMEIMFNLRPVKNDEQAKGLPAEYEALLLEEERVRLSEIIEDELLLNLPLMALHKHKEQCDRARAAL